MSVSSANNQNRQSHQQASTNFSAYYQQPESSVDMSRNEKMFIIQKYLDICKLDLFDPGPLSTKKSTHVFNSNGMCASIYNVQVPEPFPLNGDQAKTLKSTKSTGKLQKFFANLFKKSEPTLKSPKSSSNTPEKSPFSTKLRKSLRNSHTPSPQSHASKPTLTSISTNQQVLISASSSSASSDPKLLPPRIKVTQSSPTATSNNNNSKSTTRTNTLFHKVQTVKNWNSVFHSVNSGNSFLGVKLNLARPPKFKQVIFNYIESAKHRLELIKQQHKAQIMHQQQIHLQQQQQQQRHYMQTK